MEDFSAEAAVAADCAGCGWPAPWPGRTPTRSGWEPVDLV